MILWLVSPGNGRGGREGHTKSKTRGLTDRKKALSLRLEKGRIHRRRKERKGREVQKDDIIGKRSLNKLDGQLMREKRRKE